MTRSLNPSIGLTVSTQQGSVQGSIVTPGVRGFLGVPYAVAGRWEAPSDPPTRNATLQSTDFGDACVQNLYPSNYNLLKLVGFSDSEIRVPESENCLTANIWTPAVERKQKGAAVIVYAYGGGGQFGTSNTPWYNGENLVRDNDDVLLVTFNYRLNVFGQPNSPHLASKTQSQNFGVLDVEAAVKWVYANIAVFGGDPERIILAGHSAAGAMVEAYTYSHPHDNIIKGIFQLSPLLIVNPLTAAGEVDPSPWNTISAAVGCGSDITDAQYTCMKAVPFKTLETAVENSTVAFNPLIDDLTYFSDVDARFAAGQFLRVPSVIGTTENEWDITVVDGQQATFGYTIPVLTELLADVQTQLLFNCPVSKTASTRSKGDLPTWRYQYQGNLPGLSKRPDLRAYHSGDLPIWFGTYATTDPKPSKTEFELSKYVQRSWVAFARDPARGLLNFGWPLYDPTTSSLVQLGGFYNRTGTSIWPSKFLDHMCASLDILGSVNTQLTSLLIPAA
ncbi:hypothetical protein DXG01_006875 [Tephrocybe rancida]|nr:hypothetical protein DXG01_006875 [Tephrocybe rancida]